MGVDDRPQIHDLERGKFSVASNKDESFVNVLQTTLLAPGLEFLTVDGVLGASDDMTVDGSVTPVTFAYEFVQQEFLRAFSLILRVDNINTLDDFATVVGGLTNGIEIAISLGGVRTSYGFIKRNIDFFHFGKTTGTLFEIQGNKVEDIFVCDIRYGDRLRVNTGDHIECVVSDDLTTVPYLKADVVFEPGVQTS